MNLVLGDRPRVIDLWGNVTPLLRPRGASAGQVQFALGEMPVFLVDIDGALAQLRASVAIDRPLIESSFMAHKRKLRFVNPYRQAISGLVRLKAPAGWTVSPPTLSFSVNPGETFEREIGRSPARARFATWIMRRARGGWSKHRMNVSGTGTRSEPA